MIQLVRKAQSDFASATHLVLRLGHKDSYRPPLHLLAGRHRLRQARNHLRHIFSDSYVVCIGHSLRSRSSESESISYQPHIWLIPNQPFCMTFAPLVDPRDRSLLCA